MTFEDVLGAARDLPTLDQLRLIHALWDTVPMEEWPAPNSDWMAEIHRRSEDFDAGSMSASPWSEVRDRARREAGFDG